MKKDPDHFVREWLVAELKKRGHGSKKELAEYLGVSQTVLGRMLPGNSEIRRIEAGHLLKMQKFFGTTPVLPDDDEVEPAVPAEAAE